MDYVPNAATPKSASSSPISANCASMLNEICAINAELLRRRESLD